MYRRLFSSSSSSFYSLIRTTKQSPFTLNKLCRMSTTTLSQRYFADENSPFSRLEAKPFFDTLTLKEKKYAHYMSRAAFEGTRIIIEQTNPKAVAIYDMILKTFSNEAGNMVDAQTLLKNR